MIKFAKILLVFLVLPLLVGVSCGLKKKGAAAPKEETADSAPQESGAFLSQDVSENSTGFVGRLADAEARARKDFSTDAYLFNVVVNLPPTLNSKKAVEKFFFASPSNGNFIYQAQFDVSKDAVERGYLVSKDFLKNQGLQKLPSVNSVNVKEGYLKALETAENSGGKEFRTKAALDGIVLTLKPGQTIESVVWRVDYLSKEEIRSFEADASSGDILPAETQAEQTQPAASEALGT